MVNPAKHAKRDSQPGEMTRRDFVALSVTAGVAVSTGCTEQAIEVVEETIEITTPDGIADAAYIHPRTGSHPGVLIWPDAFGLRPSFRDMAKRLAANGYSVLVPNPFYRVQRAPVFDDIASFDFQNQEDRARLGPLMGSITAADAAERDASAYIPFLERATAGGYIEEDRHAGLLHGGTAHREDRRRPAGSHRRRRILPRRRTGDRQRDSPHLLAPNIQARMYFGIASNDDAQQPEAKDVLRETFADAGVAAEIEVYSDAQHGWCVTDMPSQGTPIYNEVDAERAWGKLIELNEAALS